MLTDSHFIILYSGSQKYNFAMPASCIMLTIGAEYLMSEECLFSGVSVTPDLFKPLRQNLLLCDLCCEQGSMFLGKEPLVQTPWRPKTALLQAAGRIQYEVVAAGNKCRVKKKKKNILKGEK